MTPGQQKYVEFRLAGLKPQAAYLKAFPQSSKGTLKCKPYGMEKNATVKAALKAALSGKVKDIAAMVNKSNVVSLMAAGAVAKEVAEVGLSRAEKRRILKRIATDRNAARIDRLRAIQVDNLMTGDNKPVRFEGEITLHGIFLSLQKTTGMPDPNEVFELNGTNGNGSNGHNGHALLSP